MQIGFFSFLLYLSSQVQTNGECEPKAAMQDALQDLQNEFGEIAASFAVSPGLRFLTLYCYQGWGSRFSACRAVWGSTYMYHTSFMHLEHVKQAKLGCIAGRDQQMQANEWRTHPHGLPVARSLVDIRVGGRTAHRAAWLLKLPYSLHASGHNGIRLHCGCISQQL